MKEMKQQACPDFSARHFALPRITPSAPSTQCVVSLIPVRLLNPEPLVKAHASIAPQTRLKGRRNFAKDFERWCGHD